MFCRNCQGLLEEGKPFCPRCFRPVKQPSLPRRLFQALIGWFGGSFGGGAIARGDLADRSMFRTDVIMKRSSTFTVVDENTGEKRTYTKLEDVPPEFRSMIDTLGDFPAKTSRTIHKEITVRGSDGVERSYASMDEIPPDMRRLIERFTKR